MSTNSTPARTTLALWLNSASASSRESGSGATPTEVSTVENGCAATGTCPPVRALNNDDLPALASPTRPRRCTDRRYRASIPAPPPRPVGFPAAVGAGPGWR